MINRCNNSAQEYSGTGVRDYIHVMNLADGHIAALKNLTPVIHIYNFGTGRGITVMQLLKAFEEANKIKIPYEIAPRHPGDIAACYADVTKVNTELQWKAKRDIKDMCHDVWRFAKYYFSLIELWFLEL